jgi:hypothetical protein
LPHEIGADEESGAILEVIGIGHENGAFHQRDQRKPGGNFEVVGPAVGSGGVVPPLQTAAKFGAASSASIQV